MVEARQEKRKRFFNVLNMRLKYMILAAAGFLALAGCSKGGFQGPDRSM